MYKLSTLYNKYESSQVILSNEELTSEIDSMLVEADNIIQTDDDIGEIIATAESIHNVYSKLSEQLNNQSHLSLETINFAIHAINAHLSNIGMSVDDIVPSFESFSNIEISLEEAKGFVDKTKTLFKKIIDKIIALFKSAIESTKKYFDKVKAVAPKLKDKADSLYRRLTNIKDEGMVELSKPSDDELKSAKKLKKNIDDSNKKNKQWVVNGGDHNISVKFPQILRYKGNITSSEIAKGISNTTVYIKSWAFEYIDYAEQVYLYGGKGLLKINKMLDLNKAKEESVKTYDSINKLTSTFNSKNKELVMSGDYIMSNDVKSLLEGKNVTKLIKRLKLVKLTKFKRNFDIDKPFTKIGSYSDLESMSKKFSKYNRWIN